jgi:hypothetical protein
LAKIAKPVGNLAYPTSTAGLESELIQSKGMEGRAVPKPLFNIKTPSGSLESYICTGGFPHGYQNSIELSSKVQNGDSSKCKTDQGHQTNSTHAVRYSVGYDSLEKVILEDTNIHNKNTRDGKKLKIKACTTSKENGADSRPIFPWQKTSPNMNQNFSIFVSPDGAAADAIDLSIQNNDSLPQSHNGRDISSNVVRL